MSNAASRPPLPANALDHVFAEVALGVALGAAEHNASSVSAWTLIEWGQRMLPAYFRLPPSRMHAWLGERLDGINQVRGARLNVLGPRGGAKSTVATLAYVLKSAVTAREPYMWIVSDTVSQARTHLASVKAELESNVLLAAYYPKAAGRGRRWRSGAIELPNGVVIEAYGTGQRLRGRRRREHRPTLIVCDDLQNDAHVASANQRQSSRDWFHGALLKAGDCRTNVINLATALHRDALAMQLVNSPGWTSAVFRSIERWPDNMELWAEWEGIYSRPNAEGGRLNEGGEDSAGGSEAAWRFFQAHELEMTLGAELLWPEHEDLYALMRMRCEEGHAAFEREKQNWPIDPERCEWPEEYFADHIWFDEWPKELLVRTMALDPSKGADARQGDYSAYVMLGLDATGTAYVEADLARRPTPQMIADGVAHCRRFDPDAVGIEANQFQELLVGQFEAECQRQHRKVTRPIAMGNYANKRVRIRRLAPYLAERRLRFNSRSPTTRLLVDQLRDFPQGSHDDGPDALEMALRLAEALVSEDWSASDGLGSNLLAP